MLKPSLDELGFNYAVLYNFFMLNKIFTIPNVISLLRLPLAILFFYPGKYFRCIVLILAMISDGLDGYLARRWQQYTKLGTVIDPISDKFFVAIVFLILIREESLTPFQAFIMLSRDWANLLFGAYLICTKKWATYQLRAFYSGKISTALQFVFLFILTLGLRINASYFYLFILLGCASLFELYLTRNKKIIYADIHTEG